MDSITILLAIALVAAAWHIVAVILIYDYLRRAGQKVNFI